MNSTKEGTRAGRTRQASSERREQQKQELRQHILLAAGEEFLEQGYENFSLRRVAERIGYTPTTIYLYFHNKDDLLLTTVQEGFTHFDEQMQAVAANHAAPLERIEALGRAYIAFGLENPALYRLMFMQRSDFYFMPRFVEKELDAGALASETLAGMESEAVTLQRPRTIAMMLLVVAVEEGMTAGLVQAGNPLITADVLWAGAHGLVSLAISPLMSPEHAQQVTDRLLMILIDGIGT